MFEARKSPSNTLLFEIDELHSRTVDNLAYLRANQPSMPIIVILESKDPVSLAQILRSGIRACLIKPLRHYDLAQAVVEILAGSVFLCREAQRIIVNCLNSSAAPPGPGILSSREREIVNLLFKKQSDKEIAQALQICPGTVHVHLAKIYKKLAVHSRCEALACVFGAEPK